jgi:predicted dehydrogenase
MGVLGGGSSSPGAISGEGHRRLVADLVDAIQQGRPPMIPGADARRAVALVLAVYEAARTGHTVRLS